MKRVAAATLGCKVNYYDTEAMLSLFAENGYKIVDFNEESDIYIINTCTVTSLGDKKSRQMIRRAKSRNPQAVIAATGCYAQVSPEKAKSIEGVNIVLGTKDRSKILSEVESYRIENGVSSNIEDIMSTHEYEPLKLNRFSDRQRVFVKIQDGCDRFCSYCIIPFARGPVRSRNSDDILDEIKKIANIGYKEIVLSGIHLASYGKDLHDTNLLSVINSVHSIDGIDRIRLGSLEPAIINEKFAEEASKLYKLCGHFHLSLQSGCEKTLKNMNRRYTPDEYRKSAVLLKQAFPNASLTTDIITGFPGETEEDFNESLLFAEEIGFMKIHVFPFSPKKGTKAEKMPLQLSKAVKEKRSAKMLELSSKLSQRFFNNQSGSKAKVLFEQEYPDGSLFGHTENYTPVRIKNNFQKAKTAQISEVILSYGNTDFMFGEFL